MTTPTVNPLPPAPSRRQAREDHTATADAFAAALPPMVDQINEVVGFVNDRASDSADAAQYAESAQQSADAAAASAADSEYSSQSALAAAAAAQSAAGLPSLHGNSGKFLQAFGSGVRWWAAGSIERSERTADSALSEADKGALISLSGSFTQTFSPAAALGSGWMCYLQNSGTGDITVSPASGELIDDLSSYIIYPGEVRLVQCDGLTLRTIVLKGFNRTFTASGTFIPPPGYSAFSGLLWGGGGGGGKGATTAGASGGGGGACVPFEVSSLNGATAVVIGAGGAGAFASVSNHGGQGGDSSFGHITAYGGGPGGGYQGDTKSGGSGGGCLGPGSYARSYLADPAPGGQPYVSGDLVNVGFGGGAGRGDGTSVYGGAGGAGGTGAKGADSLYGGAGGGSSGATTGPGGTSIFGGNGGTGGSTGVSGGDGYAPGGGGGGCGTGPKAGDGGRGELRIMGII